MAKKGNVKKGFANYLLILFIAIIAAFFIIVTIMLFTPFKSILGFKYFVYYGDAKQISSIKSAGQDIGINFSNIENVDIECGFSNVIIKRAGSKIDSGKIVIENKCSGFAREDQDTDFKYDINFTDNTFKNLKIKVTEPEGFLFFKKDITISLLTTIYQKDSFNNTKININSTKGNVFVGNNEVLNQSPEAFNDTSIKSLDVKNTDGDIFIFEKTSKISDLMIKTNKGYIDARANFEINNLKLNALKSKINFNGLTLDDAKFNINNSDLNINNLNAKNQAELDVKSGYITVNNLEGTITSNSMISDMGKATITINNVKNGNVVFPNANDSVIKLGSVDENSQVYLRGKDCDAKINKLAGVAFIETTGGNVAITTKGKEKETDIEASPRLEVKTGSGNINLKYKEKNIKNNYVNLKTNSGSINVDLSQELAFVLNVFNTKNEVRDNKNISIEGYGNEFVIPLVRNGGTNNLNITSDGKIAVNFIK